MVFSDVLWDPNVHSHLLDASAVLVELNSARSTPRTWMLKFPKGFFYVIQTVSIWGTCYIFILWINYIDCRTSRYFKCIYVVHASGSYTPWKAKNSCPVSILLMAWSGDFVNKLTWCLKALGAFKSWVKLTSIYIDHIVSDMLQEKTKPSNTLPDFFGIESLLKHPACVWFAGAGPCGAINHLDWDPFKELGGQNALFWKAQGSDLSVYDFKSQWVSEDSTTVLPSQNIIFYCPHYHPVSWCIIRIPS